LVYDRQRRVDDPEHVSRCAKYYRQQRDSGQHYVRRYGVSLEEALHAIATKPDACPICDRVRPLVFDHDAETHRFRGWLCRTCNAGIGQFGDTIDGARRAVAYLEAYLERSQKI
jgi:hypothetical protein